MPVTHPPAFGVNTIATSAASESVNKPLGETITLLAFRNKSWSNTKGSQGVPHIFHNVQGLQDTHASLDYPQCCLNEIKFCWSLTVAT